MLLKEYRICMPLTVEEYRVGQLYMISKHSSEQSGGGEGVEVIRNEPHSDPVHGQGQYTEKRIYLSSKLPNWMKTFVPRMFYITEKAWNYYPYTLTEYTCSFVPRFQIRIETRFENGCGDNDNVFGDTATPSDSVCVLDILTDDIPQKYYKESEDLSSFVSVKTGRGPLVEGWRQHSQPIMCSYKRVEARLELYGLQSRTEAFIHRNIRDILLVGHRQAVAWIDEWHGMTVEEVRHYEQELQQETNEKMKNSMKSTGPLSSSRPSFSRSISVTDEASLKKMGIVTSDPADPSDPLKTPRTPNRLNSTPE
ncbi:cytoplasmic phosphatidylinositol transfer protein 1b [Amia ocellicauda]|uniref:cytoplasmic phosphatidylinositol transfer protein 1b n=1 Tax=Amia ocellicauda TaxID=2972642 RepID=UPI0034642E06